MELLFSASFDLTCDNLVCDGTIRVEREDKVTYLILTPAPNGAEELRLKTETIRSLELTHLTGCGEIGAKTDEQGQICLCRFTMSNLEPLSEFVKAFNHFLTTGEYVPADLSRLFCPVCGTRYLPGTRICPQCARGVSGARRILTIAKPFFPGFIAAGFLLLLSNGFSLIIPALNRMLIDGYLTENAPRNLLPSVSATTAVVLLAAAMLICHLLKRGLTVGAARLRNRSATSFVDRLRVTLYEKIEQLSLSSVARHSTGSLITRVSSDCGKISDFLKSETIWLIDTGLLFVAICIYFLVTRPLLLLLILLPVPLIVVVIFRSRQFIRNRYHRQWLLDSRANNVLHDILKGIRIVKIFGKEEAEIEKFSNVNADLARVQKQNETVWAIATPIMSFLAGTGEFLVLYFGAKAVLGSSILGAQMSVGELIQTAAYAGMIYSPLHHLTSLPQTAANAATSAARVNEVLAEETELAPGKTQTPITRGEIVFEDVSFGYTSYEPVLKQLNLSVAPGEMIGIVGASGAGKSTLINLLMRLYDVNEGSIRIDGTDLRDYDKKTLTDSFGVVFQETFLFDGSVYENLLYARPDASPQDIFRAARIACCHEFILALPEGYNTRLGQNGYTLSGGERQRIAIARAVLKDPKILILDEATASLDTATEEQIQTAIGQLVQGRTTIAIAHRLSTLRHADRIIVIDRGRVAESGTHEELLRQKGLYYDLVLAQRQTLKMKETAE